MRSTEKFSPLDSPLSIPLSRRGDKGARVRLLQEWLCLHHVRVQIDGLFGPATETAVRLFQKKNKLPATGVVEEETSARLIQSLNEVLQPIPSEGKSLNQMIVAYAEHHLRLHPREIGGENRGPWIRLYLNGSDGQPWCAGFVCFILRQACASLRLPLPIQPSLSCDLLAAQAQEKGFFRSTKELRNRREIPAGSLFLCRRAAGDWTHVGELTRAEAEIFHTIEGNADEGGSNKGYEVCRRIRSYVKKDFILWG